MSIEEQIELEKRMTQLSVEKYRLEFQKNAKDNFSNTKSGNIIMGLVMNNYVEAIQQYLDHYSKGNAVRSTIAAHIISQFDVEKVAYIAAKSILNIYTAKVQVVYKAIGQSLENEFRMNEYRSENQHYYDAIQKDLNSRGAKANRKGFITSYMFKKRLDFHLDKWSTTEKVQTGLILVKLFIESTGLMVIKDRFEGKKQVRYLEPTEELRKYVENLNTKLEILEPFFLPMVCPPKDWTGIFEGGYLSPYLKRNKVIKNNCKEYLNRLKEYKLEKVYTALNLIQATSWQINREVFYTVTALWDKGIEIAGLPSREDEKIRGFPYPEITKDTVLTDQQKQVIQKWKREAYEIHKSNVTKRSLRILTSQILRIADQFVKYEKIWFPYQMDFRGRMYPIPVLLHPQGSDLAKGLLRFGEGKKIRDGTARNWLYIHGANMWGYDKVSYNDRVKWVEQHRKEILEYAESPLSNLGWTTADKPLQFLAFAFEFKRYQDSPEDFETHLPIQLDGTCNGLQHYSALLKDSVAGQAVNLINGQVPSDIYAKVAEKLIERLEDVSRSNSSTNVSSNSLDIICVSGDGDNSSYNNSDKKDNKILNTLDTDNLAQKWLTLGINRKLTKRPVMVLPYGGTRLSCREYIAEYLLEHYSPQKIWEMFQIGNNPTDCVYKVSLFLSKYLWEAIRETLKSAIVGMDYIKSLVRETLKHTDQIEWWTPMGLLIHQAYQKGKKREIKTELFGKFIKTKFISDTEDIDKQRQLNGICPNFIHSLDASCLMLWLLKCKEAGITQFMSVHDCYGVLAPDTETSARLLREAFVEIYEQPILDNLEADLTDHIDDIQLPDKPEEGDLRIEDVLDSDYFFN